jgi:hypothetical protein
VHHNVIEIMALLPILTGSTPFCVFAAPWAMIFAQDGEWRVAVVLRTIFAPTSRMAMMAPRHAASVTRPHIQTMAATTANHVRSLTVLVIVIACTKERQRQCNLSPELWFGMHLFKHSAVLYDGLG